LEVAEDDPTILANAAHVLAYFGEDIEAMIALVERAFGVHPISRGLAYQRRSQTLAANSTLAIEHEEISLRLSPRARSGLRLPS